MPCVAIAVAHLLWHLLPRLTTSLQFATALLGFCVAVVTINRRVQRWRHRRRR
jgi:hypothetical protein